MITEMLHEALAARPPRGDTDRPHLSDTVCDLARWAERSGEPQAPRPPEALLKMQNGLWWEESALDLIETRLRARFAHVYRRMVLAFDPFRREARFLVSDDAPISSTELVGHPDLVCVDANDDCVVVEVKTTAYLGKEPIKDHWVEQTMNYATALGAVKGIIVATDFKRVVEAEYVTAEYEAWSLMRMKEILAKTDPEAFPPAAEPRQAWACDYCSWLGCARNPRFEEAEA